MKKTTIILVLLAFAFLGMQAQTQSGINKLHFEDLLREIKLIRDRRTTVK
ncbi:MAG: hypothetical protein J6W45_09215 [Bacteroidales bacterium]|nr:hypothetical protein [Bacteroidales bacterium]